MARLRRRRAVNNSNGRAASKIAHRNGQRTFNDDPFAYRCRFSPANVYRFYCTNRFVTTSGENNVNLRRVVFGRRLTAFAFIDKNFFFQPTLLKRFLFIIITTFFFYWNTNSRFRFFHYSFPKKIDMPPLCSSWIAKPLVTEVHLSP